VKQNADGLTLTLTLTENFWYIFSKNELNLCVNILKKYIKYIMQSDTTLYFFLVYIRQLLGITNLDKEKNQCVREKTGEQNIVKEIKQYQKK
jgi:hypothetical protein